MTSNQSPKHFKDLVLAQDAGGSNSDCLHGRVSDRVFHPSINKIHAEHPQEYIKKDLDNFGGFPASPDRRQTKQGD